MAAPADKNAEDIRLPTPSITLRTKDRRGRLRFPLDTELRYQLAGHWPTGPISGTGQVENISSRGLAFRANGPLEPGLRLKVSMAWPAKLDECMLRLAFEGVVLAVRGGLVVVTIERPNFRTAGKGTSAAQEEIADTAGKIGALLASNGASPGEVRTIDQLP
jgi:hypothetical protein